MDFDKIFLNAASLDPQFEEAVDIARKNSSGNVWLIGGYVYRTISNQLYDTPLAKGVDFDFLVESPNDKFNLPGGWYEKKTSYGHANFVGDSSSIDYVPLSSLSSIVRRGLEPTIDNFFTGTHFNIQSIAYDIHRQKVIGDIGIESLIKKEIRINNIDEIRDYVQRKGIRFKDLITAVEQRALNLSYKFISHSEISEIAA